MQNRGLVAARRLMRSGIVVRAGRAEVADRRCALSDSDAVEDGNGVQMIQRVSKFQVEPDLTSVSSKNSPSREILR